MRQPVQYKLKNLSNMGAVDELISASKSWHANDTVVLDYQSVRTTWPNTTASLAATLQYLRSHKQIHFVADRIHPNQSRTWVQSPRSISGLANGEYPTNTVWRYSTEDEAHRISDAFMNSLTDLVICEAGVIDTLNWCIYEVLDNVFQHSHAEEGFVMLQIHTKNRTCVLSVTDTGRGIHRAMAGAAQGSSVDPTRVRTAENAISHALEQGITSKGNDNQGNGLHGLRRAVEINGGTLTVRSGRGSWRYQDGRGVAELDLVRPLLNVESSHSTTVDWRLDCAMPVSINDALGRAEQESAILSPLWTEDGYHRIDAAELETMVGFRQQGTEVRTRIQNYLAAGAGQVVLDLTGIPLVSSSFADEVLGKLARELGETEFRNTVYWEGASKVNRGIIERAIELRLNAGY
ncbi:STAS-like domain-containing protein [Curtobacterium sp. VKM Ac-2884]|uniref:STAS-like domain-containing protein n=1 Tax=Curtobacterium sp. VKM Ac-2884 TaxID=2783818 RepID=UPI00188C405C|nr:DUF4325 domain-containing protein [Curtobacterium sp. VKM Ac-2884]MBF4602757.1 DUF4325 domain-containing protein [Curtobacterium sp. VKM Ac-2884]